MDEFAMLYARLLRHAGYTNPAGLADTRATLIRDGHLTEDEAPSWDAIAITGQS